MWPHVVYPEVKQICCSTLHEHFCCFNGKKVFTLTHLSVNNLEPRLKNLHDGHIQLQAHWLGSRLDIHTQILTKTLDLDRSTIARSRRWLKLQLPPQVKLIQILASSVGAEAVGVRINTAACQPIGTMLRVSTVGENVQ